MKHLRANVVAYVALFVALGGTAWALEVNSVRSKHIVDGQIKSEDVRDESLVTADIDEQTFFNDNSLDSLDIAETGLFNDNSLDGGDINESSLSGVNAATLGGFGLNSLFESNSDEAPLCDPESTTPILCEQTALQLERPTRVLLIGSLTFNTNTGGGAASCTIFADGVPVDSNSIGENTDTTDPGFALQEATMIGITSNQGAGTHDYELRCSEEESNITFNEVDLVAVTVGVDSA